MSCNVMPHLKLFCNNIFICLCFYTCIFFIILMLFLYLKFICHTIGLLKSTTKHLKLKKYSYQLQHLYVSIHWCKSIYKNVLFIGDPKWFTSKSQNTNAEIKKPCRNVAKTRDFFSLLVKFFLRSMQTVASNCCKRLQEFSSTETCLTVT